MTLLHSTFFRSAVFGLVFGFGFSAQAAMPERPSLHVITLDGKAFDLAAQRGKWVIVNYWATWCVPCIKEMPDISRFVAAHKNVAAIGLAYDDSEPADIKDFLAKHPVVYPVAQVGMDQPPKDFDEPRGLPTTYLISPDGKVAKHIVGPVTEASLAALIGQP
ncbi:TlpA family protein disulfide reductase [Rhodanobacter ginsengiterrae]|uniref:TlpA family protein disulfide reductase n=1 Tax=Rhodanobacter ginsengiterrae TaxID=2008451 RepID=UPI003CE88343